MQIGRKHSNHCFRRLQWSRNPANRFSLRTFRTSAG
nr:MAG TPA: hypothetical protein [Caudoviricetes sp.]